MADISKINVNNTEYNLKDVTARSMIKYVDVTVTTGTTLYADYYYVNGDIPTGYDPDKLIGMCVISSTSNRPAFAIQINNARFRVYSNVADTVVTVRLTFLDI
ncbi:MAG: hypothetical protein J6T08_10515 [Lentisphaeria bacterium]|nr:hypothetical protein [Lentisphaeria bacterium]